MKERINDKIKDIEEYISDLESYVPSSFNEYTKDHKTKDACERCFEKIVESLADLRFLVIKEKGMRAPKDDIDAFAVLSEERIISEDLSEKLKDSKRMRNVIAHEYGTIDDTLVFEAISKELGKDSFEFLKMIGGRK